MGSVHVRAWYPLVSFPVFRSIAPVRTISNLVLEVLDNWEGLVLGELEHCLILEEDLRSKISEVVNVFYLVNFQLSAFAGSSPDSSSV